MSEETQEFKVYPNKKLEVQSAKDDNTVPRPFNSGDSDFAITCGGLGVAVICTCLISEEERKAIANHLVLCWNSHDELVKALKVINQMCQLYIERLSNVKRTVPPDHFADRIQEWTQRALKATAQTQEDKK